MGLNWEVNIRHTKTLSLPITVNASPNSSTCAFRAVTYFTDVLTVRVQAKHSNHSVVCLFPLSPIPSLFHFLPRHQQSELVGCWWQLCSEWEDRLGWMTFRGRSQAAFLWLCSSVFLSQVVWIIINLNLCFQTWRKTKSLPNFPNYSSWFRKWIHFCLQTLSWRLHVHTWAELSMEVSISQLPEKSKGMRQSNYKVYKVLRRLQGRRIVVELSQTEILWFSLINQSKRFPFHLGISESKWFYLHIQKNMCSVF